MVRFSGSGFDFWAAVLVGLVVAVGDRWLSIMVWLDVEGVGMG